MDEVEEESSLIQWTGVPPKQASCVPVHVRVSSAVQQEQDRETADGQQWSQADRP